MYSILNKSIRIRTNQCILKPMNDDKEHPLLKIPASFILELPQKELIRDFVGALNASIKMDIGNNPPKLMNANDIFDNFGVSIEDQVEAKISLTRRDAFNFLFAYGKKIKGTKLNRNYLNQNYYSEKFKGREVPRLGKKDLVFTYAEIQHLVGYGTQLELPKALLSYIIDED